MQHKVVYMGTPEFAVSPLAKLLEAGVDVAAVVTVPDKPAGRGLKISESAVKKYAVEHGLEILQPTSLKDEAFLERLASYNADLFVVVAFRMLPKVVWSMPKLGTFNLHASLLPQYRGAAPINWAVINGESESGVTTFLIDEQIDTGNILLQRKCSIAPDESAGELHDKLMAIGSELVLESVRGLYDGSLSAKPQSLFIAQEAEIKPAPKLTRELCRINWERGAKELLNLIRGLSPYPATISTLTDGTKEIEFKIYRAKLYNNIITGSSLPAGDIISDNKSFMAVCCGDGAIELEIVQAAGKRKMAVKEFLAGFRDIKRYRFKSE